MKLNTAYYNTFSTKIKAFFVFLIIFLYIIFEIQRYLLITILTMTSINITALLANLPTTIWTQGYIFFIKRIAAYGTSYFNHKNCPTFPLAFPFIIPI